MTGPAGPCGCGCALTEETSYGPDVDWFATNVLGTPLDPWERYACIHGGELLPDGRPRFRKLLIIVARQQGKTYLCKVLTLFWMFVERWPLTLGTSTNLGYAKEFWQEAVALAESCPDLASELGPNAVRKAAGEECLTNLHGSRFKIAASNRKGGRSLSIDRLVLDELREHDDWSAWGAAYNAMSARPYGQCIAITNMGDETSVVLDSLRDDALAFIEDGEGDGRTGLLEWSAPEGSDPEDPAALAMSNPNLGRRTSLGDLLSDARRAKRNGGEELATFLTEILCIRVKQKKPAIDAGSWLRCLGPKPVRNAKSRVALCLDVAPSMRHATLYAAYVLEDGRTQVDFVKEWTGVDLTARVRRDLPSTLKLVKPQTLGWLPTGPAAALAADLAARPGWPPAGVTVQEVKGELASVCMGFEAVVSSGTIVHCGDPLLDSQIAAAQRLAKGDTWVFSRKGEGDCDALYAAAAAVHLARTLPAPVGKPRLVVAGES